MGSPFEPIEWVSHINRWMCEGWFGRKFCGGVGIPWAFNNGRDAAGIYKEAGGRYAEEKSANVGEISHSASADVCDRTKVDNLDKEPESNQQGRGNEGHANEDDEEDYGANTVARKSHEKCSHDGSDGAAGSERRDLREGVAEDLRHHSHDSSTKIEEEESKRTHCLLNLASKGP